MTRMRVAVDGLPLLGEASIATYLRELLLGLATADGGHEYRLVFRAFRGATRAAARRLRGDPELRAFPQQALWIPDRVLEWCWTRRTVHLPLTEAWLGRPDVFLSTIYLTPVLHGVPSVMIAYDLIPLLFPDFYGADRPALEARIRRGVERAAAVIAISECTRRDFVQLVGADPARVHVIHPGVAARFRPDADPAAAAAARARLGVRPPYLLYVGSLGPHKNVETLVRVFRRLRERRGLPQQLVLCGRAAWGRTVVRAADDLVRAGACRVLDFVAAADVPHLYRGADAFAFLSLYEGFGLPPLEAMACGVPVVVSSAGALPEVVGDAGLQVGPRDEPAIEAALERVLTDAGLRADLRRRGLARAARFSWDDSARRTLAVLARAREGA